MLELSKDITWKDRTIVLMKGETISKKTTLRHIKKRYEHKHIESYLPRSNTRKYEISKSL